MIARGDLAVECGPQRLAEVQEEILWICEAAHVPVIWATQVLENLPKKGSPSRRKSPTRRWGNGRNASCSIRTLRSEDGEGAGRYSKRMQAHQEKKRSMLRQLRLAASFPTSA